MKTNTQFEHFSRQLEKIGIERKKNLDAKWADAYDCQPDIGFRHRDFEIQFGNSTELEKALGRQFKNRLMQLAGLVGYFGSFCRNYTESKKTGVGQGAVALLAPVKEIAASFEDILIINNPTPPIPSTSTYTPIVSKVDFEDRPSIVAVPQTSKALLGIYRNHKNIYNAIQYALACGLIQCVNDNYAYGKKGHTAKKYAWNKVCEHQLRELMKKHGILIPSVSRDSELEPFEKPAASENVQQLYYKVRLGKGMRTPGMTEQKVCQILSWKHRNVLEPFLDRLAYVNEGRAEAEKLNFRFSVRITNGYNVKNGCRAYSLAGGLVKKSKKQDVNEESFEEYFRHTRNDEPVEYDVRGSVPRINRLVNFGVWDDWNTDPYSEMFPGFCSDPAKRQIAKSTYMLYEFEQSGLKIKSAVARKCPEFVKSEGGEEIRQTMEYWYRGVWKWQGDSLGSLAFLYEDAAYSKVDVALKKLGYDFIRKFDCWVFPKGHRPDEREFRRLVKDCVTEWYRTEYAKERDELEFLESAGVRELKRHLFNAEKGNDMTNRQFARYGAPKKQKVVHPENDVPVMPMKKRPPMEKSGGWRKSALAQVGAKGDVLTLKDDLGYIQVAWKNVGADTGRNLVSVLKGSDAKWRVRWFSDSNGVRTATEILTDEQYREYSKAAWQNKKLLREGFATANPFTA